jgi:hypothetical protein
VTSPCGSCCLLDGLPRQRRFSRQSHSGFHFLGQLERACARAPPRSAKTATRAEPVENTSCIGLQDQIQPSDSKSERPFPIACGDLPIVVQRGTTTVMATESTITLSERMSPKPEIGHLATPIVPRRIRGGPGMFRHVSRTPALQNEPQGLPQEPRKLVWKWPAIPVGKQR